jgi:hypothetical protein
MPIVVQFDCLVVLPEVPLPPLMVRVDHRILTGIVELDDRLPFGGCCHPQPSNNHYAIFREVAQALPA